MPITDAAPAAAATPAAPRPRRGPRIMPALPALPALPVLAVAAVAAVALAAAPRAGAEERALRLAAPPELIENGLIRHLLPRFRFKTRIRVEATPDVPPPDPPAELALVDAARAPGAAPVLTDRDGRAYAVALLTEDPDRRAAAERFRDWLRDDAGRRVIESHKIDGAQAYMAGRSAPKETAPVVVEGDADLGARLALVHCGRCHVVDARNKYGGIGSTPSFAALRSMPDWQASFAAFWTTNPHPSFTQIEGVTEPFDPARPPPIAPLEMTVEDAEAISAYAATIPPKDLGGAVVTR